MQIHGGYTRGVHGHRVTVSTSPNSTRRRKSHAGDVAEAENAADPAPNDMTSIHTSPWGGVQSATVLAPGVTLIETASHGGLHLAGRAIEAIPRAVGATFINGPSWAEEDCELAIALAILHAAGLVPSDKLLGLTPARMADIARRTARRFDAYACALEHLPAG